MGYLFQFSALRYDSNKNIEKNCCTSWPLKIILTYLIISEPLNHEKKYYGYRYGDGTFWLQ